MFAGETKCKLSQKKSRSDLIQCKNEDCDVRFVPKTYNAAFCSPECRRVATNRRLLENYHREKKKKGEKRVCRIKVCTTVLSVYNKEDICESCKRERFIKRLVSWGWDESKLRDEYK